MIEIGDVVTLSTTVYAADGITPANGGSVVLTITLPDQSTSTPAVANVGTGLYSATFTTTQTGTHTYRWLVTGANAGAQNSMFEVEQPTVGMVSLEETKAYLNILRSTDDELLRSLILAASDLCEGPEGTGQTWRRTVVTNELHSGNSDTVVTNRRPVTSLTALSIDGTAQTVGNFDAETWRIYNPNGVFSSSRRVNNVSVSYVAGGQPVPAGVRNGVLEMVRHLYAMRRGGSNLPRQEEPDYTESIGYLIPNRVAMAWRQARVGL
jgi:uncharacterized phiE125 gp8 family phage protein